MLKEAVIVCFTVYYCCTNGLPSPEETPFTALPPPEELNDLEEVLEKITVQEPEEAPLLPIDSDSTSPNQEGMIEASAQYSNVKFVLQHSTIFIYGAPISNQTNGKYVLRHKGINGYPVYRKKSGTSTFYFYQRNNRRWYLDTNEPSENSLGILMNSKSAGETPWHLKYTNGGVVVTQKKIYLYNFAYSYFTTGIYTFSGLIYRGHPVYQKAYGDIILSVYRHKSGMWVLDYNDIRNNWSGVLGYSYSASSPTPYGILWNYD